MGQLKDKPCVKVQSETKKQLSSRYTFTEGWYDALLNSEFAIRNNNTDKKIKIDEQQKLQIVEIGVYEGASSCFWSDFYLNNPDSRLISIDPFTGSEEHLKEPEKYPGLSKLEVTARENIAKSDNAGKVEIIKGYSHLIYPHLFYRYGEDPWIDVLYIDGAHDSISVARDITLYVPMVKPGGVVFFDDYAHPDVKRAVDMSLNAFAEFELAMFTGWQLVGKIADYKKSHG
ncbi:MAG: class I SAM-dependent methyltransferase [Cryomorphaceae bacterium]|jgi:predicted O-methyltransferase YrrM|nr:class I SAM-dependent methyltransferase [Cryomorphaceae bacterium]|tara:strand:- start:389 stop:1078 length:690 start_codon:yes stop_codon:yes gene_type:complete